MLEAIDRIERYASLGRARFDSDELVQTWILFHLRILGQATRALSADFLEAHPEIPAAGIVGMRNIIVHQYFGIDKDLVWASVVRELGPLRVAIQGLLDA